MPQRHLLVGIQDAADQTDRLRDQLVDLLLDGGRGAEAVAVRREIYERRAIHQDYLKLRHAAQQAGQWADLSGWALNLLRDRAHAEQWYVRELISVLVSENLLDEAWAAAMANPGQVPESQWFQLIEVREQDHPADVIRHSKRDAPLRAHQTSIWSQPATRRTRPRTHATDRSV